MNVPVSIGYMGSMMNVSVQGFFSFVWVFLYIYPFNFVPNFLTGKRRYNIKLWKTFTDCFNCLPIAAIIDEKIFCCHGGDVLLVLLFLFFF